MPENFIDLKETEYSVDMSVVIRIGSSLWSVFYMHMMWLVRRQK